MQEKHVGPIPVKVINA